MTAQLVDEAGIRFLTHPDFLSDTVLATKENARMIREEILQMASLLTKGFRSEKQPFGFTAERLDDMTDYQLCVQDNGRRKYLEHLHRGEPVPPIMTPLMAKVAGLGTAEFRKKMYGKSASIMNWQKGEQAGKSRDSYQNNIFICTCLGIEHERDIRPLVLLPAECDLEDQMEKEWLMIKGFYGLLDVTYNNRRYPLSAYFDRWFDLGGLSSFWLRRTAGDRAKARFLNKISEAYFSNIMLLLTDDEADVGLGSDGVVVDWFKSTIPGTTVSLYDCLRTGQGPGQNFKVINYSATLEAFLQIKNAVNVSVPTEASYRNWRVVPRYTLPQYATIYDCPELILLGDTCSPQHSPYGDDLASLKKFIRLNFKKENPNAGSR